ncbi:MAG: imidazole glycerol phosphate synthase subunit HisF [Candidatus Eisenbacteria bacterium]|nr:imidazole glycerol phosphate synthase subunit HisF [Candidatus Eisenbacteria bacterium]
MRPRVIPVLLVDSRRRLVKSRRFKDEVYVGDPFNVIRLFNEKEVDELCVLDICATLEGRRPRVDFVRALASECFMPLTYGGGVQSTEDAAALFKVGVEKVLLGTAAADAGLVRGIADVFGSQAVAACVDVRSGRDGYRVHSRRGQLDLGHNPIDFARQVVEAGAGEIVVQSIDHDGCGQGYDLGLVSAVAHSVGVPVVALGGAGDVAHLRAGLGAGASAVASGSAFVFIGRLRAVLITYPDTVDLASPRANGETW